MGGETFVMLLAAGGTCGLIGSAVVFFLSEAKTLKRALLAGAVFAVCLVAPALVLIGLGFYNW